MLNRIGNWVKSFWSNPSNEDLTPYAPLNLREKIELAAVREKVYRNGECIRAVRQIEKVLGGGEFPTVTSYRLPRLRNAHRVKQGAVGAKIIWIKGLKSTLTTVALREWIEQHLDPPAGWVGVDENPDFFFIYIFAPEDVEPDA